MSNRSSKAVSLVEAARLIYRTRSPSKQQIQRVYARMKSGALPVTEFNGDPMDWTTTEGALAEYLARRMVQNRKGAKPPGAAPRPVTSNSKSRSDGRFRSMYYSMWRDYFLALMLRRRMAHRSGRFHKAVVAGQALLLAGIVASIAGAVRYAREPAAPEHVAVESWIAAHTDRFQVTKWHPLQPSADGKGVTIEVEYRYSKDTPKTIHTSRTFRVTDGQAEEVFSE